MIRKLKCADCGDYFFSNLKDETAQALFEATFHTEFSLEVAQLVCQPCFDEAWEEYKNSISDVN